MNAKFEKGFQGEFFSHQTSHFKIEMGFGNRHLSKGTLQENYGPSLRWLRQVHGTDVVPAQTSPPSADGHLTNQKNHVLMLYTADCIPILGFHEDSGFVFALHAGWRGLLTGILPQALRRAELSPISKCHFFAGPHIRRKNFEVKEDIFPVLRKALQRTPHLSWEELVTDSENSESKEMNYHVDLTLYLKSELQELGASHQQLWISEVDTYSSEEHFSYRKGDRQKRLYSYIHLL